MNDHFFESYQQTEHNGFMFDENTRENENKWAFTEELHNELKKSILG